jgi:phosphoribosyl-ATP pyrophosphohydrolase/phosphoribosyl-AMP cyclohydrolase
MTQFNAKICWNEQGLVPVIVQDVRTNAVLMQAYMNEQSLAMTLAGGFMVYYSRSRQTLWKKGETSGQLQRLMSLSADCDGDCLLAKVEQAGGGACHTGEYSCFYTPLYEGDEPVDADAQALFDTAAIVAARRTKPAEGSYTRYLFDSGLDKILKKVGEECAETIIAAKNDDEGELVYEVSDLFYHLLVLLEQRGVSLGAVMAELRKRQKG